jgi:hypothetical protein
LPPARRQTFAKATSTEMLNWRIDHFTRQHNHQIVN